MNDKESETSDSGSGISDWDNEFLSEDEENTSGSIRTPNKNTMENHQDGKNNYSSKFKEEEEEEDWGKEFEVNNSKYPNLSSNIQTKPNQQREISSLFHSLIQDSDSGSEETEIPKEYLIEHRTNKNESTNMDQEQKCFNVEKIKNNTQEKMQSVFYSKGLSSYSRPPFHTWLLSLVSKHSQGWKEKVSLLANEKKLQYSIGRVRIWTEKWCFHYLEHLTSFKNNNMNVYLQKYYQKYFEEIKKFLCKINENENRKRVQEFELLEIEQMFQISCDIYRLFNSVQFLESRFQIPQLLKDLNPNQSLLVDLISIESEIHHCYDYKINKSLKIMNLIEDLYKHSNGVFEITTPDESQDQQINFNYLISMLILTDIQLHKFGLSPLTVNNNNKNRQYRRNVDYNTFFELLQDYWNNDYTSSGSEETSNESDSENSSEINKKHENENTNSTQKKDQNKNQEKDQNENQEEEEKEEKERKLRKKKNRTNENII
ncbi:homeobox protein hmx3 [Anaeramoeba flamelloides]|uniref:Homeobox protein hmx3 n=1 Tax=Anaeramoeba flamelloides TaxID=1746091 RepID=A0ABQ8XAZ3_9EUKA|nr:homeobox protein hmx3 [Anaeramoeba flamelloides]